MSKEKYETYFNQHVRKVLEELTLSILKEQPAKPIRFMKEWINSRAQQEENTVSEETAQEIRNTHRTRSNNSLPKSDCESENEDDNICKMEELKPKKVQINKKFAVKPRASISAQAFGKVNKHRTFTPVITEKQQQEKDSIRKILQKSFMFSLLEEDDTETLVGCMKKRTYQQGQYVIKQGDSGNELYIVSEGELTCKKRFKSTDADDTFLKIYKRGESFGQLSLLYNVPRQASILANQQCTLWELDRETFNSLVRDSVIKKKAHFKHLLSRVNIFQKMEDSEFEKLVDSVKAETYESGDYVCKQGDQGDCIYVVDKGSLIAQKQIDGDFKQVFQYGPGSYFGQIALLCETTRKASIKCIQKSSLLTISRNQFSRLIGLDEEILKDFSKYEGLKLN